MDGGKKKVGIVGGTGFTGGELVRILLAHPRVQIQWIYSRNSAGDPISSVHKDLAGMLEMTFVSECSWDVDVVFLCLPHETARHFVETQEIPSDVKIVDLSRDYRLDPAKDDFVYGLPEVNKKAIQKTMKVANPGCFATSIQLALLPIAQKGALEKDVQVTAMTGSTGAGKGLSPSTHFTWRNNNISVYKALRHQHIGEVRQTIRQVQPSFDARLNFIPMRGNFARGILASIYTDTRWSAAEALLVYQDYFRDHPFVHITNEPVDLKQVVGTNRCLMSVNVIDGQIHLVSVIDNLIKGASGQAVQNMNLIFGLPETSGLLLKSIAY